MLVSIHNNALPDGVNPFTNNGTSVYYNQPRSVPLARAIQAALVRRWASATSASAGATWRWCEGRGCPRS